MDIKTYLLIDERLTFSLNQLSSFKRLRIITPIVFLVVDYLFIFAMFGFDHYNRSFFIYICILTAIVTIALTNAAIKRYSTITGQVKIYQDNRLELTTILDHVILLRKGGYEVSEDVLTENRQKEFKTYIVTVCEEKFTIIPEWFDNATELNVFLVTNKLYSAATENN